MVPKILRSDFTHLKASKTRWTRPKMKITRVVPVWLFPITQERWTIAPLRYPESATPNNQNQIRLRCMPVKVEATIQGIQEVHTLATMWVFRPTSLQQMSRMARSTISTLKTWACSSGCIWALSNKITTILTWSRSSEEVLIIVRHSSTIIITSHQMNSTRNKCSSLRVLT